MPHKDIFNRALGVELIKETKPIIDLLRYIQEESNSHRQDGVAGQEEYLAFLEEVFEIQQELSQESAFSLISDGLNIEIFDFCTNTKRELLDQLKEALNSGSYENREDVGSNEISVSLRLDQWVDIFEKMTKYSKIIDLLHIYLQLVNKINKLYSEAAQIYDRTTDEEGQQIRTETRCSQAVRVLGLTKGGKRRASTDRFQLYLHYMIFVELAERCGKATDAWKNATIKNLASHFGVTESTAKQYIKEEISKWRQKNSGYLSPHPQKTYLPWSG